MENSYRSFRKEKVVDTVIIKHDLMPFICRKAEEEGKSITEVIDDMLRSSLDNTSVLNEIVYKCHNCKNQVDYEINSNKGYCDYCESVVFIDKS